jgi:nascent polypeptide-associated complex subunit alpha
MMPGMNPAQMRKMMQRMGISQVDVPADIVIIRSKNSELVIENPSVTKVNMMGQETYQVTGHAEERSVSTVPDINEDDIKTVMEQAKVDREKAVNALTSTKGDLAKAIMDLSSS